MSTSPETTEGTTVAPPWLGCTSTSRSRLRKKPSRTPYSRNADGTPAVSDTRILAGPPSPPPPPSSPSSPQPISTMAIAATTGASLRMDCPFLARLPAAFDRAVDVRPQAGELRQLLRLHLVARLWQTDLADLLHGGRRGREDDDPVAEVDGLVDVVGHEDDGDAVPATQVQHQVLQVRAGLSVDRGERLVHEQDLGLVCERAGDRHALLHPAGELPW